MYWAIEKNAGECEMRVSMSIGHPDCQPHLQWQCGRAIVEEKERETAQSVFTAQNKTCNVPLTNFELVFQHDRWPAGLAVGDGMAKRSN